jgi:hypothetical protein
MALTIPMIASASMGRMKGEHRLNGYRFESSRLFETVPREPCLLCRRQTCRRLRPEADWLAESIASVCFPLYKLPSLFGDNVEGRKKTVYDRGESSESPRKSAARQEKIESSESILDCLKVHDGLHSSECDTNCMKV